VTDKDGGYGIKDSDSIVKNDACDGKGWWQSNRSDTLETPSVSGVDVMNWRV
jgi:hypothetical protein